MTFRSLLEISDNILDYLADFSHLIFDFVMSTIHFPRLNIEIPVLSLLFGSGLIVFITAKIIAEFIT